MKRTIAFATWFAVGVLALPGCARTSQPSWKATSTGLQGADVSWCDSTRIAAQYSEGAFPGKPVVLILDLERPTVPIPVPLAKAQEVARDLHLIGCEGGVLVLGGTSASAEGEPGMYTLAPDGSLALLASPKVMPISRGRSRPANLQGKLIAAPMPRLPVNGTYAAQAQCARGVRPGFKLLCFDSGFERLLALQRFVVVDYLWDDPVSVPQQHGGRVAVANPNPRIFDKAGKPIVRASFLYGLDKQQIARLDEDDVFQVAPSAFAPDPQEAWVYAPCKDKNKSRVSMNDFDRVCRYRLDGQPHRWEEVFRFPQANRIHSAIQTVSIDSNGNVLFDLPGSSGSAGGIFRFDAAAKRVERIVATGEHEYVVHPVVAPDGRAVLYEQNNRWKIAQP